MAALITDPGLVTDRAPITRSRDVGPSALAASTASTASTALTAFASHPTGSPGSGDRVPTAAPSVPYRGVQPVPYRGVQVGRGIPQPPIVGQDVHARRGEGSDDEVETAAEARPDRTRER